MQNILPQIYLPNGSWSFTQLLIDSLGGNFLVKILLIIGILIINLFLAEIVPSSVYQNLKLGILLR